MLNLAPLWTILTSIACVLVPIALYLRARARQSSPLMELASALQPDGCGKLHPDVEKHMAELAKHAAAEKAKPSVDQVGQHCFVGVLRSELALVAAANS